MGKGTGKKGGREETTSDKKSTEEPKIPGVPRPAALVKKAKKAASREKKAAMRVNSLGPEGSPVPIERMESTLKNLQHAKWPALFKRHLGVIESHIRNLDRVMQSMKSEMEQMREKDRLEWELGERGNWRVICEMMDRARDTLVGARISAQGILPPTLLKDKKGLGVVGTTYEPLGPKLAQRAKEMGYTKRGKLGRDPNEVDSDSSTHADRDSVMADVSMNDAVVEGADFVPLTIGTKVPRFPIDSAENKENATATGVEPNPYFIIDTNPTPVVLNGNGAKKSKKRSKEDDGEGKKAKKSKKSAVQAAERASAEPEVDFAQLEIQLQAEIEAGTKAEEARASESADEKKSAKKRRRSSNGVDEVVEKKAKKEKSTKKRSVDKTAAAGDIPDTVPEKKVKKRKADADIAEPEEGKKKRRRKVGSESEQTVLVGLYAL